MLYLYCVCFSFDKENLEDSQAFSLLLEELRGFLDNKCCFLMMFSCWLWGFCCRFCSGLCQGFVEGFVCFVGGVVFALCLSLCYSLSLA